MKHRFFVFSLACLLACTAPGYAQEGGNPIKVTTIIHDDGTRTETIADVDSRSLETKTYSASQKLTERCVYTVDEQGRAVEGVVYNAKDTIISRVAFQYDAQGNVKEKLEKTPNGILLKRIVYIQDPTGRVTVRTFDARGKLISEETSIIVPAAKKSPGNGKR